MSSTGSYNNRGASQESSQQPSEDIQPGKGESINRIATELQKKDQRSKIQEQSQLRGRIICDRPDIPDNIVAWKTGKFSFEELPHRFHQQGIPSFATRGHQMTDFQLRSPNLETRRQSEEDFSQDRSESPSMLHSRMQQQGLIQTFSPNHTAYEEGSKKRKRYEEEALELEDLDQFAKDFKQKRIKMGFTQGDVGVAMGKLYGNDFSQTTISRFEALNLSVKNMCKLKPLLERWLIDVDRAISRGDGSESRLAPQPLVPMHQQPSVVRRRKKRTSIPTEGKAKLEDAFNKNPKPTSEEIYRFSEELNMDREVVRVWFCNRRQKQKRITIQQQQHYLGEEDSPSASPPYRYNSQGPNSTDGHRSSPSSDDEAFHTSHRMPPIIQSHFGNESRPSNHNPTQLSAAELTAGARSAVQASSVPKAVPANDASALRQPVSSLAGHQPIPLSRSGIIRQGLGEGFPAQNIFPPHIFPPPTVMKTESTTS